jgi:hypothetical protein
MLMQSRSLCDGATAFYMREAGGMVVKSLPTATIMVVARLLEACAEWTVANILALVMLGPAATHCRSHRTLEGDREGQQPDQHCSEDGAHTQQFKCKSSQLRYVGHQESNRTALKAGHLAVPRLDLVDSLNGQCVEWWCVTRPNSTD